MTEERWPLGYRHGRLSLGNALTLGGTAMLRLTPGLSTGDLARAAFVDVETTGLAGGTGTYVFLVGLGTFEDRFFRLRQFFLAHLGCETAMLAAVTETLAACRVIVSFNGRRFDLPLLETRFIMNRLRAIALDLAHLDLLYPARRLYQQRLPSCRLASLEAALLGVRREDDLPGWAIPGLYIDYVRHGKIEPLSAVFRHNALDILSLVALLGHLGRVAGEQLPADPNDCLALARWDEMEGRLSDATSLYEVALGNGFDNEVRTAAARRLACLYRRLGRWEDQTRVLRDWAGDDGSSPTKLEALVELAKVEEHRQHDYASAEALTRQALALVEVMAVRGGVPMLRQLRREALEHRLWRLRRRTCPT